MHLEGIPRGYLKECKLSNQEYNFEVWHNVNSKYYCTSTMGRRRRNINVFILVLAACTLATWALGASNVKYKPEFRFAFENGFPGDISQWQPAGDWSNVNIGENRITVFRQSDNRSYAKRRFVLPQYPARADHLLLVRGVVQTNKKVANPKDVRGAAYQVWLEDADGEVIRYATIGGLTGEQESYQVGRIVNITDNVSAITLVMNTRDSKSSFSLIDASAEIVSVTLVYKMLATVLVIIWLLLAAVAVRWLLIHAPPRIALLASLLGGGIIVGVMLPETVAIPFVEPVYQQLAKWLPLSSTTGSGEFVYKIGHFMFFFLTTLVLMLKADSLPIKRKQIVCIMVLIAIASEGMQLHLLNRSTQLFDIGVDTSGTLLAWFISRMFSSQQQSLTNMSKNMSTNTSIDTSPDRKRRKRRHKRKRRHSYHR